MPHFGGAFLLQINNKKTVFYPIQTLCLLIQYNHINTETMKLFFINITNLKKFISALKNNFNK